MLSLQQAINYQFYQDNAPAHISQKTQLEID